MQLHPTLYNWQCSNPLYYPYACSSTELYMTDNVQILFTILQLHRTLYNWQCSNPLYYPYAAPPNSIRLTMFKSFLLSFSSTELYTTDNVQILFTILMQLHRTLYDWQCSNPFYYPYVAPLLTMFKSSLLSLCSSTTDNVQSSLLSLYSSTKFYYWQCPNWATARWNCVCHLLLHCWLRLPGLCNSSVLCQWSH